MLNKDLKKKIINFSIAGVVAAGLFVASPMVEATVTNQRGFIECTAPQTTTPQTTAPQTTAVQIVEVDFDSDDKEVTFEFNQRVTYDNVQVKITDEKGNTTYETLIIEQDTDDLTVRVPKIRRGRTYNYEITGVRGVNSTTSQTLTGTFRAVEID